MPDNLQGLIPTYYISNNKRHDYLIHYTKKNTQTHGRSSTANFCTKIKMLEVLLIPLPSSTTKMGNIT